MSYIIHFCRKLFISAILFLTIYSVLGQDEASIAKGFNFHEQFKNFIYSENQKAKNYLDSLKVISRQPNNPELPYYYHYDSGMYHFEIHNMDSSYYHFNRAYDIANENNLSPQKIDAKIWIANHLYFKGDTSKLKVLFNGIIKDSKRLNYVDGLAGGYFGLTMLEKDDSKALQWFIKIDSIYSEKKEISAILANTYSSIGKIYHKTYNNWPVAKNYYNKSLAVSIAINHKPGITFIYDLLGNMAYEKGNYPVAIQHFENKFKQDSINKDTIGQARTLAELAKIIYKKGSSEKAKEYLQKALLFSESKKDETLSTSIEIQLAKIAMAENNLQQAIEHIKNVERTPNALEDYEFRSEILGIQINIAEKKGQFEQALKKQRTLDSLRSSKVEEENREVFLELENQFNRTKTEKELALLQSQKKLAEEQKRNQSNILIGTISLATLSLLVLLFLNRNRQKSNEKLRQLDAAKSAFFTNISHEFRTPLALIKAPLTEKLNATNLNPTEKSKMQIAQRNVERVEELVGQLLELAKLESGEFRLRVSAGNITQFVKVLVSSFEYAALDKDLTLEVQLPEHSENRWYDRDALTKIITNLMANAIKYAPEGEMIKIKGTLTNEQFIIEITNYGVIIPEEKQREIFNRFYQTKPDNPGTGVGLALAKQLAKYHRGDVILKPTSETNTTFVISLGCQKSLFSESDLVYSENLSRKIDIATTLKTKSALVNTEEEPPIILVAEDNNDMRNYLYLFLSETYIVKLAKDGNEALKMAKIVIPDLILSDVMMPGLDGNQLIQKLKEDEHTSHIPIILLTAKVSKESKIKSTQIGADDYITKPFDIGLLEAKINQLLSNRKRLQERYSQEVILKPKDIAVTSTDQRFLEKIQKILDEQLTNPEFTTEKFGAAVGMSRMQFYRKLKAITGLSGTEFIRSQRLQLAATLLQKNEISITEIGYTVGFNDPSYFSKCFKERYGCTPKEYINNS